MKRALLAGIASLAVAGCTSTLAPGTSPYERQTMAIAPAEKLEVNGPFKVMVLGTADTAEVTLFGPPEMLADTVAEVDGETLTIRFVDGAKWSWNPGAGMHANVRLPKLSSVSIGGSGRVNVVGVKTEEFSAGTGGSGKITIKRLEAETVQLGIGGSGSIEVQGAAESGQFGVGGSGSIEAKRLRVKTAQIGIGGSGSIFADVSEKAEIGIGGSGRVEVVGGAECAFAEAQANQIECR